MVATIRTYRKLPERNPISYFLDLLFHNTLISAYWKPANWTVNITEKNLPLYSMHSSWFRCGLKDFSKGECGRNDWMWPRLWEMSQTWLEAHQNVVAQRGVKWMTQILMLWKLPGFYKMWISLEWTNQIKGALCIKSPFKSVNRAIF